MDPGVGQALDVGPAPGDESDSEFLQGFLDDVILALDDAFNACACGGCDVIGDVASSLDVENLAAVVTGIATAVDVCQCDGGHEALREALDLTIQLGSGLGQLDQQGWRLVPGEGQLSSDGGKKTIAVGDSQWSVRPESTQRLCQLSCAEPNEDLAGESSRDLTLGQTARVCGAAELAVCSGAAGLTESFSSAMTVVAIVVTLVVAIRTPLYSHLGNESVRKNIFYGLAIVLTKS
jgi:hypothetical protein